jgi:hypothetical protein
VAALVGAELPVTARNFASGQRSLPEKSVCSTKWGRPFWPGGA